MVYSARPKYEHKTNHRVCPHRGVGLRTRIHTTEQFRTRQQVNLPSRLDRFEQERPDGSLRESARAHRGTRGRFAATDEYQREDLSDGDAVRRWQRSHGPEGSAGGRTADTRMEVEALVGRHREYR